MRRNILILFLAGIFSNSLLLNAQDIQVKSLRVFSSSDQTSFPLIDISDPAKSSITIEFDIQSEYQPDFSILFRFCDENWNPVENTFLLNPIHNTEYNLWFDRLPLRIKGAKYHYSGTFPNENVTFPFSGKWKFFVIDPQEPEHIYAEGKFYVVYPEVRLSTKITRAREEGETSELAILGRHITINTSFTLPDSLFPHYVKLVEVIVNKKIDYPIIVDRLTFDEERFYDWNGSNRFAFTAKEIKPGNEYRHTDFRDENIFNQPVINPQRVGIETSNLFKKGGRDFNGGTELLNYRDDYAEYVDVNFKIRPPENITSPVFLVGSFSNWQVLPQYEMFDDDGLLFLKLNLKRGAYDYQFVTGEVSEDKVVNVDWNILEGNFWETENDYHVFLFYETKEKGGYDKIIGYQKINSGEIWKH